MTDFYVEWHRRNAMPNNATAWPRIAWHVEHAKFRGCPSDATEAEAADETDGLAQVAGRRPGLERVVRRYVRQFEQSPSGGPASEGTKNRRAPRQVARFDLYVL